MTTRRHYSWKCGSRTVDLGSRTYVMGILNVTPDSFSDGGRFFSPAAAVVHALEMVSNGADIIDVGGESTRPGSESVSISEEIQRVVPAIQQIREKSDVLISIDTTKSAVAQAAIEVGADIVNDVSALENDPEMITTVAESGVGVVLMHKQGSPQTMQNDPMYADVTEEIGAYLKQRINFAVSNGVSRSQIVVDPGIGFGKTLDHNLNLLRGLPKLAECGSPVLMGASRKSFIGKVLEKERPEERVAGSLSVAIWSIMNGVQIIRAHDVMETCDACKLVDTLMGGEK